MSVINFDSKNLVRDWISFNIQGLTGETDLKELLFTPLLVMNDESKIRYSDLKNKYHVSLRQYTKNWFGTQIIFPGKDAVYFYKLIKTQKFD